MSERLPEITTYFSLSSESYFDPQIVVSRIPIAPTRIEKMGDPRPALPRQRHARPPVKFSSWKIECKDRKLQSIDAGIREVLDIVWPHRAQIIQVIAEMKLSACFVSYVRIYEMGVVYDLSRESMKRMAELEAEWNMDLYDFSEVAENHQT